MIECLDGACKFGLIGMQPDAGSLWCDGKAALQLPLCEPSVPPSRALVTSAVRSEASPGTAMLTDGRGRLLGTPVPRIHIGGPAGLLGTSGVGARAEVPLVAGVAAMHAAALPEAIHPPSLLSSRPKSINVTGRPVLTWSDSVAPMLHFTLGFMFPP